jgi:hypothetical protein
MPRRSPPGTHAAHEGPRSLLRRDRSPDSASLSPSSPLHSLHESRRLALPHMLKESHRMRHLAIPSGISANQGSNRSHCQLSLHTFASHSPSSSLASARTMRTTHRREPSAFAHCQCGPLRDPRGLTLMETCHAPRHLPSPPRPGQHHRIPPDPHPLALPTSLGPHTRRRAEQRDQLAKRGAEPCWRTHCGQNRPHASQPAPSDPDISETNWRAVTQLGDILSIS